jgi:(1->4)-alpha-D-glucan 1-alpha-D-glucosylmutase
VVAFARGGEAITVIPRLTRRLNGEWGATTIELPPGCWHNELTGDETPKGQASRAELFGRFPVCLLSRR